MNLVFAAHEWKIPPRSLSTLGVRSAGVAFGEPTHVSQKFGQIILLSEKTHEPFMLRWLLYVQHAAAVRGTCHPQYRNRADVLSWRIHIYIYI